MKWGAVATFLADEAYTNVIFRDKWEKEKTSWDDFVF